MTKAIARVSAAASGDEATPPPSIAKVQILWSENGAVPTRSFPTLWKADAALARAFAIEPPPSGGSYDKTGFVIEWTDGMTHEGRVDVTPGIVSDAIGRGGILRAHVEAFAQYLLSDRHADFWTRHHGDSDAGGLAERQAWGRELLVRLEADRRSVEIQYAFIAWLRPRDNIVGALAEPAPPSFVGDDEDIPF